MGGVILNSLLMYLLFFKILLHLKALFTKGFLYIMKTLKICKRGKIIFGGRFLKTLTSCK